MNLTVGRACPQRAESDVFHARRAARRDGLALPDSWSVSRCFGNRQLRRTRQFAARFWSVRSSAVSTQFSRLESQRDSAPKPRVARNELPWGIRRTSDQPQRGCVFGAWERRNPFGVGSLSISLPRVVRDSQPWAGGRNPLGIGDSGPQSHPGRSSAPSAMRESCSTLEAVRQTVVTYLALMQD